MSFLVLLSLVLIEKLTALRSHIQNDAPWLKTLRFVESYQCAPWLALLILVAMPLVLVTLALGLAEYGLYGLLAWPLHLLLLLYSLGRGDVRRELGPCRDALRRGDEQGAVYAAERDLGLVGTESIAELAQRHLVWRAYEGFFTVVFWYALLGPVLALGYRLLDLTERHAEIQTALLAKQLRHALDWLPSRFFVLSLALAGNFNQVCKQVLPEVFAWSSSIPRFVSEAAFAAIDISRAKVSTAFSDLWMLLVRTTVFWYSALALFMILN